MKDFMRPETFPKWKIPELSFVFYERSVAFLTNNLWIFEIDLAYSHLCYLFIYIFFQFISVCANSRGTNLRRLVFSSRITLCPMPQVDLNPYLIFSATINQMLPVLLPSFIPAVSLWKEIISKSFNRWIS